MSVDGAVQQQPPQAVEQTDLPSFEDSFLGQDSTTSPMTTSPAKARKSTNPFSEHSDDEDDDNKTEPADSTLQSITLDTHDSMSSLDRIGGSDSEHQVEEGGKVEGQVTGPRNGAVLVARTSENWEIFDDKPATEGAPVDTAVTAAAKTEVQQQNGGGISREEGHKEELGSAKSWETFDEKASKDIQKKLSIVSDERGAVCAADAMVTDSQWTALDDSNRIHDAEGSHDNPNLPFRKTQSMRATSNRKIMIVDSLNKRRLSNSSLDRGDPRATIANFSNEDELTRKFKVDREWQVFVLTEKRVPGTKSKWLPVNITVIDGILAIRRSTLPTMPVSSQTTPPPDAPPLYEFRLHHNHTLTKPVSRAYDRKTKLHQIKLRQSRIKEKRTLKNFFLIEHISMAQTIVKIGCPDLNVVQSLSDKINEAIRQLPVTRQQGVAYRMNEVFVDVKDCSDILMNCDGAVLERSSLNRVYVQAFLSGAPDCQIVLNDVEAILLQGKSQMTTAMTRQVRMSDVVLHPCVDEAVYKSKRELHFSPVDGYPFELLRCAIEPYVSPPVNVSALMEFSEEHNTVRITASFNVRKKVNLNLRPIKDLVLQFPIQSSWSPLFLADTKFGGKKSVRSTTALRGSFRRKVKSSDCQIETFLGSAKYEPEHGAIVWRVGHYLRSETPLTFRCDMQLKSGMHKPDISRQYAEVNYSLPGSSTGLQIRSCKVNETSPEKWVKYSILYHYRIQMFPDLSID